MVLGGWWDDLLGVCTHMSQNLQFFKLAIVCSNKVRGGE